MNVSSSSDPNSNNWAPYMERAFPKTNRLLNGGIIPFYEKTYLLMNNIRGQCLSTNNRRLGVEKYLETQQVKKHPKMAQIFTKWNARIQENMKIAGYDYGKLSEDQFEIIKAMKQTIFTLLIQEQHEHKIKNPFGPFFSIWNKQGEKNSDYSFFLLQFHNPQIVIQEFAAEPQNNYDMRFDAFETKFNQKQTKHGINNPSKESLITKISTIESIILDRYEDMTDPFENLPFYIDLLTKNLKELKSLIVQEFSIITQELELRNTPLSARTNLKKSEESRSPRSPRNSSSSPKEAAISQALEFERDIQYWMSRKEGMIKTKQKERKQQREAALALGFEQESKIKWERYSRSERELFEKIYESNIESLSSKDKDLLQKFKEVVWGVIYEEQEENAKDSPSLPYVSIFNFAGELDERYWINLRNAKAKRNKENPLAEPLHLAEYDDFEVVQIRNAPDSRADGGVIDLKGMRQETGGITPKHCDKVSKNFEEQTEEVKTRVDKLGVLASSTSETEDHYHRVIYSDPHFTEEDRIRYLQNQFCTALCHLHYTRGESKLILKEMNITYIPIESGMLFEIDEYFKECERIINLISALEENDDKPEAIENDDTFQLISFRFIGYAIAIKQVMEGLQNLGSILKHFAIGLKLKPLRPLKKRFPSEPGVASQSLRNSGLYTSEILLPSALNSSGPIKISALSSSGTLPQLPQKSHMSSSSGLVHIPIGDGKKGTLISKIRRGSKDQTPKESPESEDGSPNPSLQATPSRSSTSLMGGKVRRTSLGASSKMLLSIPLSEGARVSKNKRGSRDRTPEQFPLSEETTPASSPRSFIGNEDRRSSQGDSSDSLSATPSATGYLPQQSPRNTGTSSTALQLTSTRLPVDKIEKLGEMLLKASEVYKKFYELIEKEIKN